MLKILFIDDDIRSQIDTLDILKMEGFDVVYASHIKEAITLAEKYNNSISAIVLDIMMPTQGIFSLQETQGGRRTGILLYQKYLKPLLPNIPVIVLTALTDQSILSEIRKELCVKSILYRPITVKEIIREIKKNIE